MSESAPMLAAWRGMPIGVRVFLIYAFALLALLGLTLPVVVDQAVEVPISPIGLHWMLLLAYLIFTLTLALQRKQAAYPLALGLASLTLPLILLLGQFAGIPGAAFALAIAIILFVSLRRPAARAWFVEP